MNFFFWYNVIILCRKSEIKQFSIMKVWWDFLVLVRDTFVFWLPPSSNGHITYKHSRPETIKEIIKTDSNWNKAEGNRVGKTVIQLIQYALWLHFTSQNKTKEQSNFIEKTKFMWIIPFFIVNISWFIL